MIVSFNDLLLFALAAIALVITPGPNMIYLISRSLTQGKAAGITSLAGVVLGFLFHIVMVAFGLTAVFFAIPFAFAFMKVIGAGYLLYLAFNSVRNGGRSVFEVRTDLKEDKPSKLFLMGFLTSVLNPKVAVFYLSLFPQFIRPEAGPITLQCFQLGLVQMMISFSFNLLIILTAARTAKWFANNPFWVSMQKWFMASVLTGLAVKMLFTRAR